MYTLPKNTAITHQVLNDVIAYHERSKGRFDMLERYYLGRHSIFERSKDDRLSNNKVMVNHAKYITDINVGYLLGNPVDYQVGEGFEIKPLLDAYKKQTIHDLDSEIARDVSIFGLQYEYLYANEKAEPKSCKTDNRNTILVYDDTVEHHKLFGLIYRPVYKGTVFAYWEVIYVDKQIKRVYRSDSGSLRQVGADEVHAFGDVPMICYRNNPEMMGDYESVISLIDAYNLLQSDRINDKEQLVDAVLCLYGMDFDAEQAEMLRESRMLANLPADGRVEYLIKTLQEGDVDILRQNIENDIHKISMVPNMSDHNFVGNSSGVAIRYKLLAFEQNIKNKERYMEKGLMERFRLYNHFLYTQSKMEIVPVEEADAVFKRNLPSNDYEISQMINNLADFVDAKTLISQLSFIRDANKVAEQKDRENQSKPKPAYDDAFRANEAYDAKAMADQRESQSGGDGE